MRKAYRLTRCTGGSDRLGNCEVCNTHADTLYLLTPQKIAINSVTQKEYLTSHGERQTIGHKECLSKLTK
ncbi:hypothetical protein QUN99_003418 [Vibrio parahaemolyticus]|nr:hypothetical protein [Vibrio parahaemolyticus]